MAILIERHVPERGQRGLAASPAGQCCCCCCCCLHSLGGLIGAVTAEPPKVDAEPIPVSAIKGRKLEGKTTAGGLYWAIISIVCGLVGAYFGAIEHEHITPGEFALLIALTLPGIQLVASVIAAIMILSSNRVGQDKRLAHLGRITKRAFVGALIGAAVMVPLGLMFLK